MMYTPKVMLYTEAKSYVIHRSQKLCYTQKPKVMLYTEDKSYVIHRSLEPCFHYHHHHPLNIIL